MAQRGTVIGLALWLVVGCSDSKLEQPATAGGAAISGQRGGGSGGVGADSGGPFGTGGSRAGGSGTGGDAASKACMELPQPGVFACVLGDGIPYPGTGVASVDITGTVMRADGDQLACMAQAASRTFGDERSGMAQAYTIRDGARELALTLRTGSAKPLLTVGQSVRVTVEEVANYGFGRRDNVTISVRDTGGELLYWFAQTDRGVDQLELPDGFKASDGELQCMHDWDCATRFRRGLTLQHGSDEVAIEIGGVADVGDLTAVVVDNSELVPSTNGMCFDLVVYTARRVAFFARGLASKCDWLDESGCTGGECRAVSAYIGDFNPQPTFIACVEDDSCSDGDAITCATNDETAQLARFTTTCVPPGWTVAHDACDTSDDAGAP